MSTESWSTLQPKISDFTQHDRNLIHAAYSLAALTHTGKMRDTQDPYITHPLAVAITILDEFGLKDPDLAIGGLLHDTGEEDVTPYGDQSPIGYRKWIGDVSFILTRLFNPQVAAIMKSVTRPKVDMIDVYSRTEAEEISLDNLINGPINGVIVKMSDRLHNIRTLWGVSDPRKRVLKIDETRQVFYPIFQTASIHHPVVVQYALEQMEAAIYGLQVQLGSNPFHLISNTVRSEEPLYTGT